MNQPPQLTFNYGRDTLEVTTSIPFWSLGLLLRAQFYFEPLHSEAVHHKLIVLTASVGSEPKEKAGWVDLPVPLVAWPDGIQTRDRIRCRTRGSGFLGHQMVR